MKTVILCGGLGTRLREETEIKPKPMVEVGGKPILWHIMNLYAHWGHRDFTLALGYKGDKIKEYFLNYQYRHNDFTVSLRQGSARLLNKTSDDWRIDLIDTGQETQTGGRLGRLKKFIGKKRFMLTYGDGVGDINIKELVKFHSAHGKIATVTAVHPVARFGEIRTAGTRVTGFKEKPQTDTGLINGGFFVFEPEIFDYLQGDECVLEGSPLERLAAEGQLMAYKHAGFWQCMDTYRDKQLLENLWRQDRAPWKLWSNR